MTNDERPRTPDHRLEGPPEFAPANEVGPKAGRARFARTAPPTSDPDSEGGRDIRHRPEGTAWVREASVRQQERADRLRQYRDRATLARDQRRLPIEVPEPVRRGRPSRMGESREELLTRLLDPELSLSEVATLLGVCGATVRRYADRGILPHYRTPGNQRRFRLSNVLEFLENQQGRTRSQS